MEACCEEIVSIVLFDSVRTAAGVGLCRWHGMDAVSGTANGTGGVDARRNVNVGGCSV